MFKMLWIPGWRKLVGGTFLAMFIGSNSQAFATDLMTAAPTLLPETLLGTATNIGFGIIIAYMWQNDAKRKDELLRTVMLNNDAAQKAMLEELTGLITHKRKEREE